MTSNNHSLGSRFTTKSSWRDQQSRLKLLRQSLWSAWKNPLTARIFLVSTLLLMLNVPRTGTLPSREGSLPGNDLGFGLRPPPLLFQASSEPWRDSSILALSYLLQSCNNRRFSLAESSYLYTLPWYALTSQLIIWKSRSGLGFVKVSISCFCGIL